MTTTQFASAVVQRLGGAGGGAAAVRRSGRAHDAGGVFHWVARSGRLRKMPLSQGWLAVEEARPLPLADTSWMDEF